MRVLFLNPTGVLGGAEMCLLDLLASLRANRPGDELRVILADDGPLRVEIDALGVPCEVLPLPGRVAALGDAGLTLASGSGSSLRLRLAAGAPAAAMALRGYLRRLRGLIGAAEAGVVHTNGMKAHLLGAWAAPKGVPVVWHLHDYLGSRPVMARLLQWSARAGIRAVAVSRSVADDTQAVLGPRMPVFSIYNAVDLDRFRPGPGDGGWLDTEAGLSPAGPEHIVRVGLVATYARWKGHDVFLRAASRLSSDLPVRFYVIGGPLYKSAGSQHDPVELRERARGLGLGGRVGFAGYQTEPAQVYRALDVVVHASTRPEPFGRVIVEAMACGRAVIAVPRGGAAELFQDGVSALACPPDDPDTLAEAVRRLVADPGLRQSLGTAGRAAAEARFDRARLADEWGRLYASTRPGSAVA